MRIGMGGGAASSMASGTNAAELDFDSVQRGNPEIERRAQEVINHCWAQGDKNPILAIHDVGAGGLSNAFPELTNDAGDRKSTRLNSSHLVISYAVFCLKKKKNKDELRDSIFSWPGSTHTTCSR